jgi:hypothetical protein
MSDTNEPPDPPPIEAPQGAASQENTATSSYATALKVPAQPDVYAQQNKLQECAIGEDASATTAQRHAIRQKDAMISDKRAEIRALHVELRDKEAEFKSKLEVAKQAKEEAEAAAERAASQIEDLQNELSELKAQLRTAEDKAFQAQKEHDKQLDNRLKDVEVLCSNLTELQKLKERHIRGMAAIEAHHEQRLKDAQGPADEEAEATRLSVTDNGASTSPEGNAGVGRAPQVASHDADTEQDAHASGDAHVSEDATMSEVANASQSQENAAVTKAPSRGKGKPRVKEDPLAWVVRDSQGNGWDEGKNLAPSTRDVFRSAISTMASGLKYKAEYGRFIRADDDSGHHCVQCCVLLKNKGSCGLRGQDVACDYCVRVRRPCAKLIKHNGVTKLGWLPLPDEERDDDVNWVDLAYWCARPK